MQITFDSYNDQRCQKFRARLHYSSWFAAGLEVPGVHARLRLPAFNHIRAGGRVCFLAERENGGRDGERENIQARPLLRSQQFTETGELQVNLCFHLFYVYYMEIRGTHEPGIYVSFIPGVILRMKRGNSMFRWFMNGKSECTMGRTRKFVGRCIGCDECFLHFKMIHFLSNRSFRMLRRITSDSRSETSSNDLTFTADYRRARATRIIEVLPHYLVWQAKR